MRATDRALHPTNCPTPGWAILRARRVERFVNLRTQLSKALSEQIVPPRGGRSCGNSCGGFARNCTLSSGFGSRLVSMTSNPWWSGRESHPDLWFATPASSYWTTVPNWGDRRDLHPYLQDHNLPCVYSHRGHILRRMAVAFGVHPRISSICLGVGLGSNQRLRFFKPALPPG